MLALLFGQPERRYQSAELIRLVGGGTGAVHRQLTRLAAAGLLTVTRSGNQKHYQANPASPVFDELCALVVKTVGLVEPLRQALAPLAPRIRAACVYGSVARGVDRSTSDIDLLIVTDDLTYDEVFRALQRAEAVLARPVNPTLMSIREWRTKRRRGNSFAGRVAAGDRLFVVGHEGDLA